ncbi:MAG: hypothetical protein HEP71_17430 [Roseivirga sp.]|nr:hypothetical protein [Roseivirga sp.]
MTEGQREAERRIENEIIEKTGRLDLSFCGLKEIPASLLFASHLVHLNLGFNELLEANPLIKLVNLKHLNLQKNKISYCGFLNELPFLDTAFLSHNKLRLLNFSDNAQKIKKIDLSFNQISDLDFLKQLPGLTSLNLQSNDISHVPFSLKLKRLDSLFLASNNLSDLNFLDELTELKFLDLKNNKIKDLRPIQNLRKLESLDLRNNAITDAQVIQELTELYELSLNDNDLTQISFLRRNKKIQTLYLKNNRIAQLSQITELLQLHTLDLSENEVKDISALRGLKRLKSLNLSSNLIEDITPLLGLVKSGRSISSTEDWANIKVNLNPISSPPRSIIEGGRSNIINWFEQIDQQGEGPLFETKLMILGQGGAGKTTFAKLLLDENYQVRKGKLDATLGIEIHKGKEFRHSDGEHTIKAHLWDFGGQNIQKMLHQFFITEDCLYVLLSDMRRENANFDYWFQIINLLGPKCPVVVLENQMDAKGSNEGFAINKYRKLFPELSVQVRQVNLKLIGDKHKERWSYLKTSLEEELSNLEIVNRNVPKKWTLIRDELLRLRNKKYIPIKTFFDICESEEIGLTEIQAELCLSYLKSLGEFVYFDDSQLRSYIFLDHRWLTEGLYYILADQQIEKQQGEFTLTQAYDKWGRKYKRHEKDMLLLLLLKDQFDLCYKLLDRDTYITPLLLPNDQPGEWGYETSLRFQYNYGFMPHGIFSRVIVRLHEKIDAEQRWQSGVRLLDIDTKARAEVQQYNDPDDNRQVIDIRINGDEFGSKQLLNFIRNNIDPLHKGFRNLNVKEMVGCNCNKCHHRMKQGKKPTFYDYKKLERNLQNGRYYVDCDFEFTKQINIGDILSDVVASDAGNRVRDGWLINDLKGIGMTVDKSDRSVVISNIGNPVVSVKGEAKAVADAVATAKATSKAEVNIEIEKLLGDTEVLKEDMQRELPLSGFPEKEIKLALSDIEALENALTEANAAETIAEIPSRSKTRIGRFFNNLTKPDSTVFKALKVLRDGKDFAVDMAGKYNQLASRLGLKPLDELARDAIENI